MVAGRRGWRPGEPGSGTKSVRGRRQPSRSPEPAATARGMAKINLDHQVVIDRCAMRCSPRQVPDGAVRTEVELNAQIAPTLVRRHPSAEIRVLRSRCLCDRDRFAPVAKRHETIAKRGRRPEIHDPSRHDRFSTIYRMNAPANDSYFNWTCF